MKKRIGIRIGALLMAMLFVVSLSGCGKSWEKQVKLTDLKLEDMPNNQGGFAWNVLTGQIENLTDNQYSEVKVTVKWTYEDGNSEVHTGSIYVLMPKASKSFSIEPFEPADFKDYIGRHVTDYTIKKVELIKKEK